jgi:hypothetical protein
MRRLINIAAPATPGNTSSSGAARASGICEPGPVKMLSALVTPISGRLMKLWLCS